MKDGYESQLDAMLDRIFARSDDLRMSVTKLSLATGLAYSTVQNINRRVTRLPRLKTVLLLAEAVGLRLHLTGVYSRGRKAS